MEAVFIVRPVARSSWPRFVLALSLAALAAATACDDDESVTVPAQSGGSAGSAGAGGTQAGDGGRDVGAAGMGASTSAAGTKGMGAGNSILDQLPLPGSPPPTLFVSHEVSRSQSFVLVGAVAETSADRMSSPNYSITLGPAK